MAENVGNISGGEVGFVSMDDEESYKYLVMHFYLPYLKAYWEETLDSSGHNKAYQYGGKIIYVLYTYKGGNFRAIAHGNDNYKLLTNFKWATRKTFNVFPFIIYGHVETYNNETVKNGYKDIYKPSSTYGSIKFTDGGGRMFYGDFEPLLEVYKNVDNNSKAEVMPYSTFPDKIRDKFVNVEDYITWFDVVCFPSETTETDADGAEQTVKFSNIIVITPQGHENEPRVYCFTDGVKLLISDDNVTSYNVVASEENIAKRYTYDATVINPKCVFNSEYNQDQVINNSSTVSVTDQIECSTMDIYFKNGELAYKADCTFEQLTTI